MNDELMKGEGFVKLPVLYTERLLLRVVHMDDIDGVMRYVSNPNVAHYLPFQSTQTREHTKEVMKKWLVEMGEGTAVYFAVLPKDMLLDTLIKDRRITSESKDWPLGIFHVMFKEDNSINFGWCLAEEFWGMGIMPEALNAVIDYYRRECNISYVQTLYHSDNNKSGKAMEKCGFIKVGEKHRPSTEDGHYGEDSIAFIMRKDLI